MTATSTTADRVTERDPAAEGAAARVTERGQAPNGGPEADTSTAKPTPWGRRVQRAAELERCVRCPGPVAPGCRHCAACLLVAATRMASLRAERRGYDECPGCGGWPDRRGSWCSQCANTGRDRMRARRSRARSADR